MIIEMKNVTWAREHHTILRNIDWTVRKGEHWFLLGLNGSGKTTLLNMINGYIWPTEGSISVSAMSDFFGVNVEIDRREGRSWLSVQENLWK